MGTCVLRHNAHGPQRVNPLTARVDRLRIPDRIYMFRWKLHNWQNPDFGLQICGDVAIPIRQREFQNESIKLIKNQC